MYFTFKTPPTQEKNQREEKNERAGEGKNENFGGPGEGCPGGGSGGGGSEPKSDPSPTVVLAKLGFGQSWRKPWSRRARHPNKRTTVRQRGTDEGWNGAVPATLTCSAIVLDTNLRTTSPDTMPIPPWAS